MQLSMFQGVYADRPEVIDSDDLWENIRNGTWEKDISQLRHMLKNKGKDAYNEKKKELNAVTMSGLFRTRAADTLVRYSGLLQGDIDSCDHPENVRDDLATDPHVRMSFLSPSGKGVKIAIKVNDDPSRHGESFKAAEKYFQKKHKVKIDPACKDINRICFTSFDPEIKGNEEPVPIELPDTREQFAFDTRTLAPPVEKTEREKAEILLQNVSPEDYQTWFAIGCSLKSMLGEEGYPLWYNWSSQSPKFKPEEMQRKWNSISQEGGITGGTLHHLGREEELPPRPRKTIAELKKKKVTDEIKPVHQDLLIPNGFVGAWSHYITETAIFPQPELALGASLAFTATLLGRKIRDETDTRPNIYVVGLGRTGIGKEHARKLIKLMFAQTGVPGFGAEKLSSRSAIERTISATPSPIYLIDEFGHYISSILNPNTNSHLRDVSSMFLELYGSSSSKFFGTDKANARENPRWEIDQPSANIYACSTPESFWEALTTKSIRDGSLNRFLIFNAPEERPEPNRAELIRKIPEGLTKYVHQYSNMSIRPGVMGNIVEEGAVPDPQVIPTTEAAWKVLNKFQTDTLKLSDYKNETASMWVRAAEAAKKIALILAGSKGTNITPEEAEYGCELVRALINNACVAIMQNLSDNEYERESKRVESIIRSSGPEGISMKELVQRTRFLKSRVYRKALLDDLFESEIINKEMKVVPGKQRPMLYWFTE